MPTVTTAKDTMYGILDAAWKASGSATENVLLLYADVIGDQPSSGAVNEVDPYGLARIQHVGGGQATLSNGIGSKRYRRTGFISVQIYTSVGDGLTVADSYVQVVLDAFENAANVAGGIWFRNARFNEVGRVGAMNLTNVLVDFEYDETK